LIENYNTVFVKTERAIIYTYKVEKGAPFYSLKYEDRIKVISKEALNYLNLSL
jgi:hypothetical protein